MSRRNICLDKSNFRHQHLPTPNKTSIQRASGCSEIEVAESEVVPPQDGLSIDKRVSHARVNTAPRDQEGLSLGTRRHRTHLVDRLSEGGILGGGFLRDTALALSLGPFSRCFIAPIPVARAGPARRSLPWHLQFEGSVFHNAGVARKARDCFSKKRPHRSPRAMRARLGPGRGYVESSITHTLHDREHLGI